MGNFPKAVRAPGGAWRVGTVERVGLEIGAALREVRLRVDHEAGQVRLVKRLDAGGERLVGEDQDGRAVLPGDAAGLQRDIEAVLDILRREHDPRCVAMAPVDRL